MGTSFDAGVLISWHMIDATNQKRTETLNSWVLKKRKVQITDVWCVATNKFELCKI